MHILEKRRLLARRNATPAGRKKGGLSNVQNRTGIFAPENYGSGGRVGGKTTGAMKVESGAMADMQYKARHTRWHVLGTFHWRGGWISPRPKSWCDLCNEENLVVAYA